MFHSLSRERYRWKRDRPGCPLIAGPGPRGTCVEVGTTGPALAIRDSKHPDGPQLAFTPRHLEDLHRPAEGDRLTRDELLAQLAGLWQAPIDQKRAPHKPLLLLWLFGQFAATGSSAASYQLAEEPVSQLINEFGPPAVADAIAEFRADASAMTASDA